MFHRCITLGNPSSRSGGAPLEWTAPNGDLLVLDGPGKRLLEVDAEHLLDLIDGSSPLGL